MLVVGPLRRDGTIEVPNSRASSRLDGSSRNVHFHYESYSICCGQLVILKHCLGRFCKTATHGPTSRQTCPKCDGSDDTTRFISRACRALCCSFLLWFVLVADRLHCIAAPFAYMLSAAVLVGIPGARRAKFARGYQQQFDRMGGGARFCEHSRSLV